MKKTEDKSPKPYLHNLIGYTVCVLFVFIIFFVVLLFDHDFRFKVLGWIFTILEKAASFLPYSREPGFEYSLDIEPESPYGTW